MKRTPNPPNTLIQTLHGLRHPLQLLPTRLLQQRRFIQNLQLMQIPHADGLRASVHVVADDDGVSARSRGDGDFDPGVLFREGGEFDFDEFTVGFGVVRTAILW